MNLQEFIRKHGSVLLEAAERAYPPLTREPKPLSWRGGRKPIGAQALAVTALAEGLKRERGLFLAAEMGTGKSYMAAQALLEWRPKGRFLVVCPPHLVGKWVREVEAVGARALVLRTAADVAALRGLEGGFFAVASRERVKLGPGWTPAFTWRLRRRERILACPRCGAELLDEEGRPLSEENLRRTRRFCTTCGERLWQEVPPRRESLEHAIRRLLPKAFFQAVVLDEAHEYRNGESLQGQAAASLAARAERVLFLSGTLFGGYASAVYPLLAQAAPGLRREWPGEVPFARAFGLVSEVVLREVREGRYGHRERRTTVREVPGLSPKLLPLFLPRTVFLRLEDVAPDLPPYREEVLLVPMDPWHASRYQTFEAALAEMARVALAVAGTRRELGYMVQAGLQVPDTPFREEEVKTGFGYARHRPLLALYRPAKERLLVSLARAELKEGRKVVVYVNATGERDLLSRLEGVLAEEGVRAVALRADRVPPEKREAWIAQKLEEGMEVLLVHPSAVATGLDLLAFPTVVFFQPPTSVYTARQAARRSYRVGQTRPVRVYYMAYRDTLQEGLLGLLAAKARASLALEGVLPEGGLVEAGGEDPILVLARQLTGEAERRFRGGPVALEVEDPREAAWKAFEAMRARRGGELVPLFEGVPPPSGPRRRRK